MTTWSDVLAEDHGKPEMVALFIRRILSCFTIKPGGHFCVKGFFQNNSSWTLNETIIQNKHLKPLINTEKVSAIVILPGTLLSAFKTSFMCVHTSYPLILQP